MELLVVPKAIGDQTASEIESDVIRPEVAELYQKFRQETGNNTIRLEVPPLGRKCLYQAGSNSVNAISAKVLSSYRKCLYRTRSVSIRPEVSLSDRK